MSNAGEYPYTIEVLQRVETGERDKYGHKTIEWKRFRYCAARRWSMTNAERSSSPLENQSATIRLLCRAQNIGPEHRVNFDGQSYKVTASETYKKWDSLISLELATDE